MFRKVEINIPLLDAIKQIPKYAKFLKELESAFHDHRQWKNSSDAPMVANRIGVFLDLSKSYLHLNKPYLHLAGVILGKIFVTDVDLIRSAGLARMFLAWAEMTWAEMT
ncbi:hypothetical protein CR513_56935, partial [Mucuna pruriens]